MTFETVMTILIIILLGLQVLSLVDIWLGNYRSRVLRIFSDTKVTQYDYTAFDDEENDRIKFLLTIHILCVVFFGVAVYYFFDHTSGLFFIIVSWIASYMINKRLNAFVKDE